jgi:zinc protease
VDRLTRRVTLANGATLLVQELHSAPVVTLNLWVGSGATDDPEGQAGAAHFIEHLLFGGRGSGGAGGALVREVLDAGGHLNGETGCDATTFYQIVPGEAWEAVLERQVAVVTDASFDPDAVEMERSVIVEEARGAERHPQSFLWHRLMEKAFPDHPCRRPVLGTGESLSSLTPHDLAEHFRAHYRGGNIVEVVCGDVNADDVIERAAPALGRLAAGERPPTAAVPVTPPSGVVGHGFEGHLDRAYVLMAHRVPHALHEDIPALDVLSGLVGLGRSARLRRRLQLERGLVSAVETAVVSLRFAGLFVVSAVTSPGAIDEVARECLLEYERLADSGPTADEMEKSVRRLESAYALDHETSASIARALGHYETLGDFELAERHIDRLAAVTREDVRAAAARYLSPGACRIVSYAPQGSGAPVGEWRPEPPSDRSHRPPEGVAESASERYGTAGRAAFARPVFIAERVAPDCRRQQLPNGGVLVTCTSRAVPIASLAVSFRGGHIDEPPDAGGLTFLTQKALLRGTRNRPAAALSEEIERLGGGIGTAVERDGFGLGITVLATRLEAATELLSEVIAAPTFDAEQVARAREELLAEIGEAEDEPMRRALRAVLPLVLPHHPYGRPVRGTRESVTRLSPADLAGWHAQRYTARRMVACGAGDISEAGLRSLGELPRGSDERVDAEPPERRPSGEVVLEAPGAEQSTVLAAFLGPRVGTGTAVALHVATRGLGMMGGVLWRHLREQPPHAYTVGAGTFQFALASIIVGYATAQPGREEEVRDALIERFEMLSRDGLGSDDLTRAVRSSAGAHEIALQRGSARAAACAMAEILGTGYERVFRLPDLIRSVAAGDVIEASRAHLTRERGVASVIVKAV